MILYFKRLYHDSRIPEFGHGDPSNAGLDFFARVSKPKWVWPLCSALIGTGVAWEPGELVYIEPVDPGSHKWCWHYGWKPAILMRGRSGLTKMGMSVSEGTVDAGYRGEIMIHVRNMRLLPFRVMNSMKLGQGVPVLVPTVEVVEASMLNDSIRGTRGFGSSGI